MVESVIKASQIFKVILDKKTVSVSGLVKEMDIPKATIGRLLKSLVAGGLLVQDTSTRQYLVAPDVMDQLVSQNHLQIGGIALPYLEQIRNITGETTGFFVRAGADRLCVAVAESLQTIRRVLLVGHRRPVNSGSTGYVFMTLMSQEERMRVFDLHPLKHFTDETVTDQETYLMICDRVGKEGYAYTKNQTVSGVAGLSVPVLDPVGHLRGVISVSGPSFRFTEEIAKRESEKVMKIAKNFGNQLL